jgi:hypothetical protein
LQKANSSNQLDGFPKSQGFLVQENKNKRENAERLER